MPTRGIVPNSIREVAGAFYQDMKKPPTGTNPEAADREKSGWRGAALEIVHRQDLAIPVLAAGRASNVRGDCTAALRARFEERSTPAVRATTHLALHLRHSSFWDGHGLGSGKIVVV